MVNFARVHHSLSLRDVKDGDTALLVTFVVSWGGKQMRNRKMDQMNEFYWSKFLIFIFDWLNLFVCVFHWSNVMAVIGYGFSCTSS